MDHTRELLARAVSENSSNSTTHNGSHGTTGVETVLFLFASFALGGEYITTLSAVNCSHTHRLPCAALVRHVMKKTPIPYTVILIVLGLAVGAASTVDALSFLQSYTAIARMDAHLFLHIFLPILLFESAFVMDVHTFKKTIAQSLLLAGPGLILSSVLTAIIARYIFTYNWDWVTALLLGSILSATDPVAVVALLKDLGKLILSSH